MLQSLKRLVVHSAGYSIGDILTKAIGFLLIPVYTRFLSPADYGILAIAGLVGGLLTTVCMTTIANVVVRFYFDFDDERRRHFFGTMWLSLVIQGVLFAAVMELAGPKLFTVAFRHVGYNPYGRYVIWTGLILVISSGVPLHLFRAREQPLHYMGFNLSSFVAKTFLVVYFIAVLHQGAIGSLKGGLVAAALTVAPYMLVTWKNISVGWSWKHVGDLLVFCLPLVPHAVAAWGLNLSDRIILEHYVSLDRLGLYSFGYQFGLLASVLFSSMNNAWSPYFLGNITASSKRGDISRLVTYFWGVVGVIGLAMALLAAPLIRIMATPAFHPATSVVPWVIAGYAMLGLYIVPANVLLHLKQTHYMSLATVTGLIINIMLNLWLVPHYGIMAAAFNTFLAYLVAFLVAFILASRAKIVTYEKARIGKLLMVCLTLYAIGSAISGGTPYLDFLLRSVLIALGVPLGLWLLQFYSRQEISAIRHAGGILNSRLRRMYISAD